MRKEVIFLLFIFGMFGMGFSLGKVGITTGVDKAGVVLGMISCPTVKPEVCAQVYAPVCGVKKTPSGFEYETYSNSCVACSHEGVIGYLPGACNFLPDEMEKHLSDVVVQNKGNNETNDGIEIITLPSSESVGEIVSGVQDKSVKEYLLNQMKKSLETEIEARIKFTQRLKSSCEDVVEELKKAVLSEDMLRIEELKDELVNCTRAIRRSLCENLTNKIESLRYEYENCFSQVVVDIAECESIQERIERLEAIKRLCNKTEESIPCSLLRERIRNLKSYLKNCTENTSECITMRYQYVRFMDDFAERCRPVEELVSCKEGLGLLKRIREQLEAKLEGVNESVREMIQNRIRVVDEQLERLNKTCVSYPNPCLRVERLKRVYDILINKSNASDIAIAELYSHIQILRKLCAEQNISVENVNSLKDLDEILKKKVDVLISTVNATEVLKKIWEEKRKLLKEYVEKKKKLDLVEQKLIKRLVIAKNRIIAENETLPPAEVTVKVKNKLVKILPKGDKVVIQDMVNVTADELIYENGVLKTPMGGMIKILPSEIFSKVRARAEDEIKEIKLENQFHPRYRVKIIEKRRLLGIIPWDLEVDKVVDAETGKLLEENRPWWSFLLF